MDYDWILFDADETLFTFDAYAGLKRVFAALNVNFTKQDYEQYQACNKPLWKQYQEGLIDAKTLQENRFNDWGKRLNISSFELNRQFLLAMAEICKPFDGVKETLEKLSSVAKLGIITNGFDEIQQMRLENTGLKKYFEFVAVSEVVGVAKPHKGIFEHAFSLMGQVNKKRVLMVGDNPTSDVQGGINVGIDTCWIQLGDKYDTNITPTFVVKNWHELQQCLFLESSLITN